MTSIRSNCSTLRQSCAAPRLKPATPCRRAVRTRLEMPAPDRREAISVFLPRPQTCGGSVHATMIAERAFKRIRGRTRDTIRGNACYCPGCAGSGAPLLASDDRARPARGLRASRPLRHDWTTSGSDAAPAPTGGGMNG